MIDKEELPTTKNDLAVEDCVSRAEVLKLMKDNWHTHNGDWAMQESMDDIRALPSIIPGPRKITLDDVERYCTPRCLTIISNELLYELTHPKIRALEQEPRWIPVTERLPKNDGEYLLWGKICEDEENNYCFIGEYDSCAEEFGYWSDHYDSSTLGFLDSEHVEYHKVLAWMPLPQPYEPQESEDKE